MSLIPTGSVESRSKLLLVCAYWSFSAQYILPYLTFTCIFWHKLLYTKLYKQDFCAVIQVTFHIHTTDQTTPYVLSSSFKFQVSSFQKSKLKTRHSRPQGSPCSFTNDGFKDINTFH